MCTPSMITSAMSTPSTSRPGPSCNNVWLTYPRIVNPLIGLSKDQLFAQVSQFCAEVGLQDKADVFLKGALVAQNPQTLDEIAELDDDDRYHLRREITSMLATYLLLEQG